MTAAERSPVSAISSAVPAPRDWAELALSRLGIAARAAVASFMRAAAVTGALGGIAAALPPVAFHALVFVLALGILPQSLMALCYFSIKSL